MVRNLPTKQEIKARARPRTYVTCEPWHSFITTPGDRAFSICNLGRLELFWLNSIHWHKKSKSLEGVPRRAVTWCTAPNLLLMAHPNSTSVHSGVISFTRCENWISPQRRGVINYQVCSLGKWRLWWDLLRDLLCRQHIIRDVFL